MAAKKGSKKPATLSADEQSVVSKIEELSKKESLTDNQKQTLKGLRGELASLRFLRLAPARVNKALKAIDAISKLTGPGYAYTPEQSEKILEALRDKLAAVDKKFEGTTEASGAFTL